MIRYCGRDFTRQALEQIRILIAEDAGRTRAERSRLICQRLSGFKPDGGLKDMPCRNAAHGRRRSDHPATATAQTTPATNNLFY